MYKCVTFQFLADRTATQYDQLYWHHLVVRPSVCNPVQCGSHGFVYQRVPSRQVPICPFRHFCCSMYRLARKRTGKTS